MKRQITGAWFNELSPLARLSAIFLNAFKPKGAELSKRARRKSDHTKCRRVVEVHQDGQKHVVTRCRLNMVYLDRSKY